MCKTISFISGKGGSGKTTMALSIASILSRCGIKTLLIDCDLSTNGATYFYEEKLSVKKKTILSFYDLLFTENTKKTSLVQINDFYDFMPSLTQITKRNTKIYSYKTDSTIPIYDTLRQNYDVILFDCQAGYTDILKLVLPVSDISLSVMEADAISSAAMRSLYLKIGDIINEKKIYQVFNKASIDEYEVYSKVSGGTVFTNIETVIFDWKIRKAFSVSQIPDMENTSANYGKQILNICSILLPQEEFQEKLKKFKSIITIHEIKEKESILKAQLNDIKDKYNGKKNKLRRSVLMTGLVALATLLYVVTIIFSETSIDFGVGNFTYLTMIIIVVSCFAMVVAYINLFDITREKREYEKEISECRDVLFQLDIDKKNMQQTVGEEENELAKK